MQIINSNEIDSISVKTALLLIASSNSFYEGFNEERFLFAGVGVAKPRRDRGLYLKIWETPIELKTIVILFMLAQLSEATI